MKTSPWAALAAAVFAAPAIAPMCVRAANEESEASTIPSIPTGVLSAFPTVVQTGTKPTLTWSILYPSKVSDVAVINPPGSITLTEPVYVSVQPIGTEVTACDPSQGNNPRKVEARMKVSGSSFFQLFYGTQADVEPAYSLYIKKLPAQTTIDFGGRYVRNGAWTPFYTTRSGNLQVITLVNGDTPPTSFNLYQSANLKGHLKPYLDLSGKVKIGPMSAIVLMELGQTNRSASCFDYQDMVLLVTFSTRHPNNGHGNNLDGVDSSNPGNGSGGPNGEVDPSGGVDDEAR